MQLRPVTQYLIDQIRKRLVTAIDHHALWANPTIGLKFASALCPNVITHDQKPLASRLVAMIPPIGPRPRMPIVVFICLLLTLVDELAVPLIAIYRYSIPTRPDRIRRSTRSRRATRYSESVHPLVPDIRSAPARRVRTFPD